MSNHEFKELWEKFQNTDKSIDELNEDLLFVAASSHAHGADIHTVGFQLLDSLAELMKEAVSDYEDSSDVPDFDERDCHSYVEREV